MLLYQQQPLFIYDTFDISSWLFMLTGIPQWLLHTKLFFLFDAIYYCAPLLLLATSYAKPKLIPFAAIFLVIINWIYLQCYFIYPISSYTIFIAWLIFPTIFMAKSETTFALLFSGVRYFFLYFFFSAAVWKIVNGGLFHTSQLSAILLEQHKEMLTNSPDYWLTVLYNWLIAHTAVSYALYVLVTLMEFSFLIGFFTRRFDRYFIVIYLVFLCADYLIMRIPYFETLPFLLTIYYNPVRFSNLKSYVF